jgi:hypothetical protein
MTARERNLWIGVAAVVVLGLGYSFLFGMFAPAPTPTSVDMRQKALVDYDGATRLLRSARNITARNAVVAEKLKVLQAMFGLKTAPDLAVIKLLQATEKIAAECNLTVEQKNIIRYSDTLIGVSFEGKTNSESLFKFIQRTTESRFGIKISRLQLHVLPDQKLLNYQIVVSSLLL